MLQQIISNGIPHREIIEKYVNLINNIGQHKEPEQIKQMQTELIQMIEAWLQMFIVPIKEGNETCKTSGVSSIRDSERLLESTDQQKSDPQEK